jgi:hypothetical protein
MRQEVNNSMRRRKIMLELLMLKDKSSKELFKNKKPLKKEKEILMSKSNAPMAIIKRISLIKSIKTPP